MKSSDNRHVQWPRVALVLVAIAALALSIIAILQQQNIKRLRQAAPVTEEKVKPETDAATTTTSVQTEPTIVSSENVILGKKKYALVFSCLGSVTTTEAGLEASGSRDLCLGVSELRLELHGEASLLVAQATSTEMWSAPSLWSWEALDDLRLLIKFSSEEFTVAGVNYGAFAPFASAYNYLVDTKKRSIHKLETFPFETLPIWNRTKTRAVFASEADKFKSGPYPLIGYDLNNDNRFDLTSYGAGWSSGSWDDWGDASGTFFGEWKNIRWSDDKTVVGTFVSSSTEKEVKVVYPDFSAIKNGEYLVDLAPDKKTRIRLTDGQANFVIDRWKDKSGATIMNEGNAWIPMENTFVTDLDGDDRMDVIATLRVSTGGTGVWPYVFMAFNKPEGVQIVFAPEVGLGDREWITEITKDEQGNLNFFLKVHNDTIDAACCPSQRAFERYHYSNGRLVKVGERTLLP